MIKSNNGSQTNALIEAQRSLHDAQGLYQSAIDALSLFDDDAIYEFRLFIGDFSHIKKRDVVKTTKKQIRLAPTNQPGPETHLTRHLLESGEIVSQGKGIWSANFAFGWRIRPHLERQKDRATRGMTEARHNLEVIEQQCA